MNLLTYTNNLSPLLLLPLEALLLQIYKKVGEKTLFFGLVLEVSASAPVLTKLVLFVTWGKKKLFLKGYRFSNAIN